MRVFSKGKDLVARKKAEGNIKEIQQVNRACYDFLESLKERHHLNEEELCNLNNVQIHLLNMNVLFDNLLAQK